MKELFSIILTLEAWGPHLCNKCITFHSDNEAVVFIINKQSSKEPMLMKLVRRLVIATFKYNILFKAVHIPGVQNTLAIHLLRNQVDKFLEECNFPQPMAETILTASLGL